MSNWGHTLLKIVIWTYLHSQIHLPDKILDRKAMDLSIITLTGVQFGGGTWYRVEFLECVTWLKLCLQSPVLPIRDDKNVASLFFRPEFVYLFSGPPERLIDVHEFLAQQAHARTQTNDKSDFGLDRPSLIVWNETNWNRRFLSDHSISWHFFCRLSPTLFPPNRFQCPVWIIITLTFANNFLFSFF